MYIIAGLYGRQRLKTPKGSQTRPTSSRLRESLFNICRQSIEGAKFLDIFAGSGAMGLEALSRGADSATFIEYHKDAVQCIESNIQLLNVKGQCQILRGDVFTKLQLLNTQEMKFDIIYADPPYRTLAPHSSHYFSAEIVHWLDKHLLLVDGGILFIEEAFRSEPQLENLQTLQLKDSRRMGEAVLQQYILTPETNILKTEL